uniref:NADH-ubiquinone oxidoreductase chain 2 n=1 Tax=Holothuria spinifera TaxID=864314 RepID=A0A6C0X7P3_9ECHN|nr:NADH dehydrogenase subunit 2 [Holothuria spinifera]QIC54366.1 NADH dehydrogenase subunit 2 [Holothuria spinifera]
MNRTVVIFLLTTLISGTLLVVTSKHWFPIWLGLELSTLSLLPLLSFNTWSRGTEATLKYFLVQAFSAALLLNGATLNLWISGNWEITLSSEPIVHSIITLALVIKLGLAPCHFWFPDVLSGLTFNNGIIIACWQKIAPLFLITNLNSLIVSELIIICSILSVIIGAWGGLNQISIRKILAYSSIGHMGWISCTIFFSIETAILLFTFYILNNVLIFCICNTNNLYSLSSLSKINSNPTSAILFILALLSLGGLPPLGGFINKLVPLSIFTLNNSLFIIPFFIIGSLISLYFYLRITFNTSLTLFPQNSLSLLPIRSTNPTKQTLIISALAPLTIWGLLLIPSFYLFI